MAVGESTGNSTVGGETAVKSIRQVVRELHDKQAIQSTFLVKDKSVLVGKNGKSYISLFLSDSTGTVDARIWDNVDSTQHLFQSGDVVRIKGQVQIFQNRRQVVIHRIEKMDSSEYEMSEFLSKAARSPEEMFQQLLQMVELIKNDSIRQLTLDVVMDPEIRERLLAAPAAKTIHHAYLGGLLEHIVSICGVMKFLSGHYPSLNLDYLLFGAIFHDIGKIWELQIDQGISYTDKGKLLGHMIMAVELVEKKASRIFGFSEELKDRLKHIILSHHGKLEYGSPKTPMFLEAFVVAAIDDLDSKINTIEMFLNAERETGEKWTRFNQLFERYFLVDSKV